MKKKIINIFMWVLSVALTVIFFVWLVYTVMPPETRDFDFEYDFELRSIDAYNAFVKYNIFLPHNFITADMLSFLGEFEKIWFFDVFNLNNYRYTLKTASGRTISFTVYAEPWDNIEEVKLSDNGKVIHTGRSQFRYLDTGKLRHIYYGTGLQWIEWTANGVWYQLSPEATVNSPLYGLRTRDPEKQEEALDLFPDFIGDADKPDLAISNVELARLIHLTLLLAACIISWRFVKVKRPVWYKEGMKF